MINRLNPGVGFIEIRITGDGVIPLFKDLKNQIPTRISVLPISSGYLEYSQAYLVAGAYYFVHKTQELMQIIDIQVVLDDEARRFI